MPLRLPTRRKAGAPKEVPFRRRTPPTPQATRLMQVSLGAGLGLLVILGVLFIPKALEVQERPPVVTFSYVADAGRYTVRIDKVSEPYPLSTYRAELNLTSLEDGVTQINFDVRELAPGVPQYGGNVTFEDADGDGTLSGGDSFTILRQTGSWAYELLVFHESRDLGAKPPCPCAAGRIRFPSA